MLHTWPAQSLWRRLAQEYERQGNGRAIVAVILRESWRAGSARLLVVSTGHEFWKKPSLQLSELGSPTDVEQPVFAPWSAGISIVGREARACSEPRQRSPQPAPQRVVAASRCPSLLRTSWTQSVEPRPPLAGAGRGGPAEGQGGPRAR